MFLSEIPKTAKNTSINFSVMIVVCFSLLSPQQIIAQQSSSELTITGTVQDKHSGEPVIHASAAVYTIDDSTLVTGAITDDEGFFSIEGLNQNNYRVRISYMGYQTRYLHTDDYIQELLVDFGLIELEPAVGMLDMVRVEAEREAVTFQRDRTVYRADQMVSSRGMTAIEVLEEVPSIEIDMNGNILYRGNSNVVIHVNGRPLSLNDDALEAYLRGLPSDIIERIETIPNPSARHDPEGIGGIINIVLKEERDAGYSGRIAASANTLGVYRPNLSAGYNSNSLNLFGTYAYGDGIFESVTADEHEQFSGENYILNRDGDTRFDYYNHMINLTADYNLSESTSINLSNQTFTFGNNHTLFTEGRFTNQSDINRDYNIQSVFNRSGRMFNNDLSLLRNFGTDDHKLSADARVRLFKTSYDSRFEQEELSGAGNHIVRNQDVTVNTNLIDIKADYERPLPGKLHLESGLQSDVRLFERYMEIPDSGRLDWEYDLFVYSAYGVLSRVFGRFELEAGARTEQVYSIIRHLEPGNNLTFRNNYFHIYPSLSASFSPSQSHQYGISYSNRINRPNVGFLITNFDITDSRIQFRGNPELTPEQTHNIELSYSRVKEKYMFTVQPYFRYITNVIRRNISADEDGFTEITFINLDSENQYGTELNSTLTISQRFRINASANFYITEIDGSNVNADIESRAAAWSLNANTNYRFGFGLTAMIMGNYRSPVDAEFGRIGSQKTLNISLRQSLLNNSLQIGLNVNDLLDSAGENFWYEDEAFRQHSKNRLKQRSLMFSISYSFGRQQIPDTVSSGGGPMM
jgi:outer membrane receptor protein involved in Fe transport